MKRKIKKLAYSIFNTASTIFSFKKGGSILLYHDVGNSDLYLTVSPENFKKQMAYLKKNNYSVLPLLKFVDLLCSGEDLPQKTVALTFDDGYVSHLETVLTVLEEFGFHGTFFVATSFMGKNINNSENKPQPALDLEKIKELDNSDFADVQPHSVSHREFTSLTKEEIRKELVESKIFFEDTLGKTCRLFAYPRGKYSQEALKLVEATGFDGAVTVDARFIDKKDSLFLLPRHTINSETSMAEFKAKVPNKKSK